MITKSVVKRKVIFIKKIFLKIVGVRNECLSFCKGDVPTCDLQSIFSYQPCLKQLDLIQQCQIENLHTTPKFDPEWHARCDWE